MEQWNGGILGPLVFHLVENFTIHGINKPWFEKTSIEDLKTVSLVRCGLPLWLSL
jgi:hypothetical protein